MKKLLLTLFFFFLFSASSIIHSANCTSSIYPKPAVVNGFKESNLNKNESDHSFLFPSFWIFAETF